MFSIVSKQTDLKSNYIKELENTLLFAQKVFWKHKTVYLNKIKYSWYKSELQSLVAESNEG